MEPVWQLLGTKTKEEGWTAAHKGCLRSIISNRQFPQTRVKSCGWSSHDRCLLCLSDLVDAEIPHSDDQQQQQQQAKKRTANDVVVATPDQIERAPKGDLMHRHWACKRTDAVRKQFTREKTIFELRTN